LCQHHELSDGTMCQMSHDVALGAFAIAHA